MRYLIFVAIVAAITINGTDGEDDQWSECFMNYKDDTMCYLTFRAEWGAVANTLTYCTDGQLGSKVQCKHMFLGCKVTECYGFEISDSQLCNHHFNGSLPYLSGIFEACIYPRPSRSARCCAINYGHNL